MLSIQDQDNKYYLASFGDALIVEALEGDDVCQVDLKEMSPFESDVYLFLIANQTDKVSV
jgi:hypothetical protein